MIQANQKRIRALVERLARINAADEWTEDINPTQMAALSYLGRANRFSRAPSQVAEFMAATRGTVSQTLKALARKGLILELRSQTDKRWISYSVTPEGIRLLDRNTAIEEAAAQLDQKTSDALVDGLETLARRALMARGNRAFGVCSTCRYYQGKGSGGYCRLLSEPLSAPEIRQICHEHEEAA